MDEDVFINASGLPHSTKVTLKTRSAVEKKIPKGLVKSLIDSLFSCFFYSKSENMKKLGLD